LKSLRSVHLEPGESGTPRFELAADQFGFYDRGMRYAIHLQRTFFSTVEVS